MSFSLSLFSISLESRFKFLTNKNDAKGKNNKTKIEIEIQIIFQSYKESRNIINTGRINSAVDKPNQIVLKALPRDFVKYLDTVVVAVCDIIPCPENLIKKIAKNSVNIVDAFEKKKLENESKIITKNANFEILMSSIFFPTHIRTKLLNKVAEAYIEPNCPWDMDNSFLMLVLNIPIKKLCPKLEKNVNINPNKITFKLKLLNINK